MTIRGAGLRRMQRALLWALVPMLGAGLVSCASTAKTGDPAPAPSSSTSAPPEGPLRAEESRVLGQLADPAEATPVLAPSTVRAGERFTVTITTTGNGCDRLGDSGILLGERDATIMVYDFTSANRPGIACTMIFKTLKREIPITFTQPGEAVIRVWGRRSKQDGTPGGEPFVVERRVEVRA